MNLLRELLQNRLLICALLAWLIAQCLKVALESILNHKLMLDRMIGDGGMPSGHSATVSALATGSLLLYGASSYAFTISAVLAIVVMHDAMGVRLETGRQAKIINRITKMLSEVQEGSFNPEDTLKELVGHTPLQVISGCLLGILIALLLLA